MQINLISSFPVAHVKENDQGTEYGLGIVVGSTIMKVESEIHVQYLVQWENKPHPAIHNHYVNELKNLTDFGIASEEFFGELEEGEEGEEGEENLSEIIPQVPEESHQGFSANDLDGFEGEIETSEQALENEEYVNIEGEEYLDGEEVIQNSIDTVSDSSLHNSSLQNKVNSINM